MRSCSPSGGMAPSTIAERTRVHVWLQPAEGREAARSRLALGRRMIGRPALSTSRASSGACGHTAAGAALGEEPAATAAEGEPRRAPPRRAQTDAASSPPPFWLACAACPPFLSPPLPSRPAPCLAAASAGFASLCRPEPTWGPRGPPPSTRVTRSLQALSAGGLRPWPPMPSARGVEVLSLRASDAPPDLGGEMDERLPAAPAASRFFCFWHSHGTAQLAGGRGSVLPYHF